MRFLVDCPPKNHKSAGVRVTWRLLDLLQMAGYNAIPLQEYNGPIQAKPDDKRDIETTKEQIKKILRFFNM